MSAVSVPSSTPWPLPNEKNHQSPNASPNSQPESTEAPFLLATDEPQKPEPSIPPFLPAMEPSIPPFLPAMEPDEPQKDLEPSISEREPEREEKTEQATPSSSRNRPNPRPSSALTNESSELSPSSSSLLHLSFNQDCGCFACGTSLGLQIFNVDPFRPIFSRHLGPPGVAIVEMLFRCNILAFVAAPGPHPLFPPNKVMIWDDHETKCIGELSFRSEVRAVRLRRDKIIVILEQKIFVYNFFDLQLIHQIETIANPKGLCEVSHGGGHMVLVCLGLQKGQVRIENYGLKRTKFVSAHDSRIACFGLTFEGKLVATASTKGTLVRVFSTVDGTLLQEVRRGADRAEIYSLAFSETAEWLAVSSDKGTVHVFSLKLNFKEKSPVPSDTNALTSGGDHSSSSLSFFKGVLPKYFSSEWSVAQFRLPEGSQYIVAFGHQKNTIVILGLDGSFYRCRFNPVQSGEMVQLEHHNFLKPDVTF
ncbi:hypothetical protein AMTRI_Chr02g264970 [Amborella trichopoda]|uniref:Autophagy-related protein 18a n=1 Tax=Amborella trichopoda TaxID=13333 RepID=U5D3J6_AMBTC|nr:autophagy-related protein 18a [Amborella trichopoda]ERN16994.1 hypothetical protein AMTR_s00057p00210380 [Amborella trichopoda]|eukprot:XP_006855527.1 autophagy-related protein 18a [Amborella trichopoda]